MTLDHYEIVAMIKMRAQSIHAMSALDCNSKELRMQIERLVAYANLLQDLEDKKQWT